jgi:hypothetical protein
MPLISFRNLKLFRAPTRPVKPNGLNGDASKEGPARYARSVYQNPFVLIVVSALVLGYLISYRTSKRLPELTSGEIAVADIVAPEDLTIEDEEATAKRRAEAVAAVAAVYARDPEISLATAEKVRKFFAAGRDRAKPAGARDFAKLQKEILDTFGIEVSLSDLAALEAAGYPLDLEAILTNLLEKILSQGVLVSKSLLSQNEAVRGFILIWAPGDERATHIEDVLDVKEAKERLAVDVNALELPARRKGLLLGLATEFLTPNIVFNQVETDARRAAAGTAVERVFLAVKKGKVLIRKGDEATAEMVKLVAAINSGLSVRRTWPGNFLGTFLLFGLLFITIWFYLKALVTPKTALKYFVMMALTLLVSLLLYKLGFFLADSSSERATISLFADREAYTFALPFQLGTLLFAFLTSNTVALIYTVINSLMAGYIVQADFHVMIFSLIGGLAAIYGIKYYRRQKRTAVLKAGFFVVAPLGIFTALTLHLVRQEATAFSFLASETFMAVLGGIFSAAVAFVLLPVYENVFRFITQAKLLELTNSESEILRQLAIEAPGSYHHSLIVANLAEKAAETIKLDPLLVKAGALYHDIGKIRRPEYFIENRSRKHDAHRDLTPSMSTLVIVNHVKEGAEIARKERLPLQIREIVEQHHGNSVVRYFYQKAKEKNDPEMEKIGEESYRYPGPSPQTKEAALVMLADSVEAASRSLRVHKEENFKTVIRDIFDNYLQDGQLDDSAFSLKELRTIAQSFLATLNNVYQHRVAYPGFDFEAKKPPRRPAKTAPRPEREAAEEPTLPELSESSAPSEPGAPAEPAESINSPEAPPSPDTPLPPKDDDRDHQPPESGPDQGQPV